MRRQFLTIIIIASAILLTTVMQDVLAQDVLLDNEFSLSPGQSASQQWSFNFNKGDELTGVLSCTTGRIDLSIWLNDANTMPLQLAWAGNSVPFSWTIPTTGTYNVRVMMGQWGNCTGRIKLNVERATVGGLTIPINWIVLFGIVAIIAIVSLAVVGLVHLSRTKQAKKVTEGTVTQP